MSLDYNRINRARCMFHECCSRVRRCLALVFLNDLTEQAFPAVRDWFGSEHVIS